MGLNFATASQQSDRVLSGPATVLEYQSSGDAESPPRNLLDANVRGFNGQGFEVLRERALIVGVSVAEPEIVERDEPSWVALADNPSKDAAEFDAVAAAVWSDDRQQTCNQD